ncbi:hypothetical protein AAFC00_003878 [Neodothiora populina]|uniref:ZW10 C-terminal helical domain-containing protein n=1 Tax=Neodothiora populina TaxID=2781224 RepID=A0ABR3PG04_9PEZI
MSSAISDASLKEAIVGSVEHGAYPESEAVSSAELRPNVLPDLLVDLQRARDEVKADIRQLSRDVAPDVDGWIAQAKKLQADIEHSKATAREIVQQAREGEELRQDADEAGNKAGLLEKEVAYNEELVNTLSKIRSLRSTLDECQDAMINNDLASALAAIKQVDSVLPELAAVDHTRAYDLLQIRIQKIKSALADQATQGLRETIKTNTADHSVNVVEVEHRTHDIEAAVNVLTTLNILPAYLDRLRRDLDSAVIRPALSRDTATHSKILIESCSISVSRQDGDTEIMSVLGDFWGLLEFLNSHLPSSLMLPLSQVLLPQLLDIITTTWLDTCVPIRIDEMPFFQRVLDRVSKLALQIDGLSWPASTKPLTEWVQSAPRTWLAKRRETALGAVRALLFTKLRERHTVERVETQMISKGDALMGAGGETDDDAWDAEWGEEQETASMPDAKAPAPAPAEDMDDDDDASAWAMDDDPPGEDSTTDTAKAKGDVEEVEEIDADVDAWGWGDEDPNETAPIVEKTQDQEQEKAPSKKETEKDAAEREVTLKETYTVTAVPDGILKIIEESILDAETLMDASYAQTSIGPAATALYVVPTFVLAMYRATSSTAYGRLDTGNMLIYNDSTRLADQLRSLIARHSDKDASSALAPSSRPTSRLKLDSEIKALDQFAKRAYGAEMEAQRTILGDMLDGAQGFSSCTTEPFASACDSAVEITASRLRDVYKQWEGILSKSALLQSLGSLLGTVTGKIIIDIEDLSDIGEEESKRLWSHCDKMLAIRDLFMQKHPGDGEAHDTTGIYCPNWLKFQYLAEILEGSLADIKYFWSEGELRLEFVAEEVVDLIQALFADSDYRRKAIADIRRSRG